jgi:hypothetical protein
VSAIAQGEGPRPAWGDEPLRILPTTPLERRGIVARPYPPDAVGEDVPECFVPDPTFAEWIRDTFLAASGPLAIEEHAHLLDAQLGVLWTNAVNERQMRHVLATAEIPTIQAGGWKRARHEYQLRQWFDVVPDFVLTFSAPDCLRLDDRAFCALVDHELSHCAQAEGEHGPKFNSRTGEPIYTIRGHDVEEFIGVVARWGATSPDVKAMVAAANRAPSIDIAAIARGCGTCLARSA